MRGRVLQALVVVLGLGVVYAGLPQPGVTEPLPPVETDPYLAAKKTDDIIQDAAWAVNEPWGLYTGRVYCHGLCMFPGQCGEATNDTQYLIESPLTLSINGNSDDTVPTWKDGYTANAASGHINIDWQTIYRDGGYIGGFDAPFLPLTAAGSRGPDDTQRTSSIRHAVEASNEDVETERCSMFMSPTNPREVGLLGNSTGVLQLYASNVLEDPGYGYVGWVFSTYHHAPLRYEASYGEASVTGRFYVKYYSPTSPYTAVCHGRLSKQASYGSRTPNANV